MNETRHKEVMSFIARFTNNGRATEVIDTFSFGCCYWFARILQERFDQSYIVYDEIENHFAACIDGRIYDITGDVTGKYEMLSWMAYGFDEALRKRIVRDCINF